MFTSNNRSVGVQIPEGQRRPLEQGPPGTVTAVVPGEFFAVQYYDEEGVQHNTVVFKIGDKIYNPLNAEDWASNLSGTKAWFNEAVLSKVPSKVNAPREDSVEVMAAVKVSDESSKTDE